MSTGRKEQPRRRRGSEFAERRYRKSMLDVVYVGLAAGAAAPARLVAAGYPNTTPLAHR